jgi:hypothetical protein
MSIDIIIINEKATKIITCFYYYKNINYLIIFYKFIKNIKVI